MNKNKCPKCKCKETKQETWELEGYIIKCKQCGATKEHWEYGITYTENWKDKRKQPLINRIKNKFKRKNKSNNNTNGLPF